MRGESALRYRAGRVSRVSSLPNCKQHQSSERFDILHRRSCFCASASYHEPHPHLDPYCYSSLLLLLLLFRSWPPIFCFALHDRRRSRCLLSIVFCPCPIQAEESRPLRLTYSIDSAPSLQGLLFPLATTTVLCAGPATGAVLPRPLLPSSPRLMILAISPVIVVGSSSSNSSIGSSIRVMSWAGSVRWLYRCLAACHASHLHSCCINSPCRCCLLLPLLQACKPAAVRAVIFPSFGIFRDMIFVDCVFFGLLLHAVLRCTAAAVASIAPAVVRTRSCQSCHIPLLWESDIILVYSSLEPSFIIEAAHEHERTYIPTMDIPSRASQSMNTCILLARTIECMCQDASLCIFCWMVL